MFVGTSATGKRPDAANFRPSARAYARFLQPDPIGYGDGMNMYAYVKADPVNNVDPTGKAGVLGCVAGMVIGGMEQVANQEDIFSWTGVGKLGVDCATGAIGAKFAYMIVRHSLRTQIAKNAAMGFAAGVANTAAKEALEGGSVSAAELGIGGVGGIIGGGVGTLGAAKQLGEGFLSSVRNGTWIVSIDGKVYTVLPESAKQAADLASAVVAANVAAALWVVGPDGKREKVHIRRRSPKEEEVKSN